MRPATTLLFDLDGTLTDNFSGIASSIRHALAAMGSEPPPEAALRSCVGPPLRQSFARLLATDDADEVERAIAHYRERYAEAGWRENVVYGGIANALARCSGAGATLVLCTSKPQPYAERIVAHFGLASHFRAIYGADLAGKRDDKSKLVSYLLRSEGFEAAACAMIGDREHDIHAAHANGMRAVGVLWGYGSREELAQAGAEAIVATPDELPAALAGLAHPESMRAPR
jgi:phosphoglycolate phosphatase